MPRIIRPSAPYLEQQDERTPLLAGFSSPAPGRPAPGNGASAAINANSIVTATTSASNHGNRDDEDDENDGDDCHDLDFDARFRKWKVAVAQKFKRSDRSRNSYARVLVSVFDGVDGSRQLLAALAEAKQQCRIESSGRNDATLMSGKEFSQQVDLVKKAFEHGIYPKMITTGSSGSYFVRVPVDKVALNGAPLPPPVAANLETTTVAVFKPKDEEPYGNLNPKRQFVRKYLWWAMGRPCLIPNFSYLSEVGASYLDSRLVLQMVPRTELVELSSPSFHYAYADRKAFETSGKRLPEKIGSYQTFLTGYVMASDFLRRHPWPSRSRSLALMLRDFEDERQAHKVSRKQEKARLRKCGIALKRLLLCRTVYDDPLQPYDGVDEQNGGRDPSDGDHHQPSTTPTTDRQPSSSDAMSPARPADGLGSFVWTPHRMQSFRLELEKLVVLDFLMRNTDRGLDNFMIHHDPMKDEIKIGAIDNSLSFPIKHPNEIRQYPFGWLWLPTDLIGLPFSPVTRQHFLPILNDPLWWQDTVLGLRSIFAKDPHFDESKFEKQVSVMKGQGWNLVRSLENPDEGPLDLCAREKRLVVPESLDATEEKLNNLEGVKLSLTPGGQIRADTASSVEGDSAGLAGRVRLALFDTPTKPRLSRSGSSSNARFGPSGRPSGSRPIGVRASPSYRQALIYAATCGSPRPAEGAHPRSLPENDLTDPFDEDRAADESAVDPDQSVITQPDAHRRRPSLHQRIMSLQETDTTSALLLGGGRTGKAAPAGLPLQGYDTVVGRTGIEVLESLDKQRKRESKMKLFGGPGRKRSSTESTVNTVDLAAKATLAQANDGERKPDADALSLSRPAHNGVKDDAGFDAGEGAHDMISSIVSDPGTHRYGLHHQRSSSDNVSKRMASSGYIRRDGSAQWDDGVLSEEDEEQDEEVDAGDGLINRARRRDGTDKDHRAQRPGVDRLTRSDGDRKSASGAVGPSIEGVLARSSLTGGQRAQNDSVRQRTVSDTSRKCHVPHLPHARALAKAERVEHEDDEDTAAVENGGQAKSAIGDRPNGSAMHDSDEAGGPQGHGAAAQGSNEENPVPDNGAERDSADSNAPPRQQPERKARERKIKVVVERLVSDTRQAWLTWM